MAGARLTTSMNDLTSGVEPLTSPSGCVGGECKFDQIGVATIGEIIRTPPSNPTAATAAPEHRSAGQHDPEDQTVEPSMKVRRFPMSWDITAMELEGSTPLSR